MAEFIVRCLGCCSRGYYRQDTHAVKKELPAVKLDTFHMGHNVVIIKQGQRICGTGGALGNAPIVQDKAYFEVKIQQTGTWSIGVATRNTNINNAKGGDDLFSWVMRSDGSLCHNGEERSRVEEPAQVGFVFGLSYDHVELNFFVNGKPLNLPITGIKGSVYPCVFVDDGAILDVYFEDFFHTPPATFDKIMIEKSIL